MLRLLVLAVAILGLASLLPSTPNVGALPADQSDLDCLGPLRSALVRSDFTLTLRDTGFHIGRDTTPGDFHGASGIEELAQLFECELPIPGTPGTGIADCIDFDSLDRCGDPDGDDYVNQFEWTAGSDPNNPFSTPEYTLLDEQTGSNTCADRDDNDLDGHTDNGDAGCRLTCDDFGGGKDRCSDSDRDGWLKYVEVMWGSDPDDASSTPENLGDCIDFDNEPVCQPF